MKLVDLFCGGGGSSRGFHDAGFTSLAAIDQEKFCVDTYNLNFGNVAFQANISKLRSEKILEKNSEKPLIVTASPPCEPFTVANANRVKDTYMRLFDDEIGRLTLHALRLITDLQPEFFLIENVKGIIDGNGRELLTEECERLGLGTPYITVINALDWGVPSNRLRVFISNFKLENPKLKQISVSQAINDLPQPNYPHEFEDHIIVELKEAHKKKIISLNIGEGMVYFRGSGQDYKNYMRLDESAPAPVVMGKSRFVHPFDNRLLSPRENARLMSFPDVHKFVGSIDQIFDMVGEAVPPSITYQIANQIKNKI